MQGRFLRRTYLVPAELEEAFVVALWRAGTLGVQVLEEEETAVRLEAWFAKDGAENPDPLDEDHRSRGVRQVAEEAVPDTDWLAPYRCGARPFRLGERFFVDPGEPAGEAPAAPEGRCLLRLPARTAFGTGSHESTRLALEMLEATEVAGRRVLDVGTGTGILALAALALGARSAVAFDVDLAAAFAARENLALNWEATVKRRDPRLPPLPDAPGAPRSLGIFAGTVSALASRARFDLIVVNAIPSEVRTALPRLAAALAAAGDLIFSGLLAAQEGEVVAELGRIGLAARGSRRDGEWLALRFALASPSTP